MHFHLQSEWLLSSPPQAVWALLNDAEHWPAWWPQIARVETIDPRIGSTAKKIYRTWWTTRLGYGFQIDFQTRLEQEPRLLIVDAQGDLQGSGRWELSPVHQGTRVRYFWRVALTKRWMRLSAPLLAPLFAWNHHAVMRQGAAGMAQRLQAKLHHYRSLPRA